MTNATLPRLSRVMNRLEEASYVRREPCPGDRRATNVVLTDDGWDKVVRAAPGHVRTVRELVIDALSPSRSNSCQRSARCCSPCSTPTRR